MATPLTMDTSSTRRPSGSTGWSLENSPEGTSVSATVPLKDESRVPSAFRARTEAVKAMGVAV